MEIASAEEDFWPANRIFYAATTAATRDGCSLLRPQLTLAEAAAADWAGTSRSTSRSLAGARTQDERKKNDLDLTAGDFWGLQRKAR
jgi:hypothetical protein